MELGSRLGSPLQDRTWHQRVLLSTYNISVQSLTTAAEQPPVPDGEADSPDSSARPWSWASGSSVRSERRSKVQAETGAGERAASGERWASASRLLQLRGAKKNEQKNRNKIQSSLAGGNTQPITGKGVAGGGQSRARWCVINTWLRRDWLRAGCVADGGVSGESAVSE